MTEVDKSFYKPNHSLQIDNRRTIIVGWRRLESASENTERVNGFMWDWTDGYEIKLLHENYGLTEADWLRH